MARKILVSFILLLCSMFLGQEAVCQSSDSLEVVKTKKKFKPIPRKAALFGIFPGGGQIYNRRYWKLPIVYGGIAAGIYFIDRNTDLYNLYNNAYIDLLEGVEIETIIEETGLPSSTITETTLNSRRNRFNKQRQVSWIYLSIGYIFTIIEAYVDAHLLEFEISDDLTMNISPSLQQQNTTPIGGLSLRINVSENKTSRQNIQPIWP